MSSYGNVQVDLDEDLMVVPRLYFILFIQDLFNEVHTRNTYSPGEEYPGIFVK